MEDFLKYSDIGAAMIIFSLFIYLVTKYLPEHNRMFIAALDAQRMQHMTHQDAQRTEFLVALKESRTEFLAETRVIRAEFLEATNQQRSESIKNLSEHDREFKEALKQTGASLISAFEHRV